jgi:hypothetical protein
LKINSSIDNRFKETEIIINYAQMSEELEKEVLLHDIHRTKQVGIIRGKRANH